MNAENIIILHFFWFLLFTTPYIALVFKVWYKIFKDKKGKK